MSRRPPPPDPGEPPPKPASEMTADERAELIRKIRGELREFDKARRERRIRQGRAKPRTMREMEIFASDLIEKRPNDQSGAEDVSPTLPS